MQCSIYTEIFSIYKRFEIEILRKEGGWQAYRRSNGIRQPEPELIIPPELTEEELAVYLDDVFHEYAGPGDELVRLS